MWLVSGYNLAVMKDIENGLVDLIYTDPPFCTQRDFGEFDDRWDDDIDGYLDFMFPRLSEMWKLLKPTGSLYLHCDAAASHYLKVAMDDLFGRANFRREIIWKMPRPSGFKTAAQNWIRGHDTILYYTRSNDFTFNKLYKPYEESYVKNFNRVDDDGRRYWHKNGRRQYLKDGYNLSDCWIDIHSMQTQSVSRAEGTGYPTQKPLTLLERIILASSNPDDTVLDPFCGSGTTLVAAVKHGRQAMGIDINPQAIATTRQRLQAIQPCLLYTSPSPRD